MGMCLGFMRCFWCWRIDLGYRIILVLWWRELYSWDLVCLGYCVLGFGESYDIGSECSCGRMLVVFLLVHICCILHPDAFCLSEIVLRLVALSPSISVPVILIFFWTNLWMKLFWWIRKKSEWLSVGISFVIICIHVWKISGIQFLLMNS